MRIYLHGTLTDPLQMFSCRSNPTVNDELMRTNCMFLTALLFLCCRLRDHVADKTKQPILIFPEGKYLRGAVYTALFGVLSKSGFRLDRYCHITV